MRITVCAEAITPPNKSVATMALRVKYIRCLLLEPSSKWGSHPEATLLSVFNCVNWQKSQYSCNRSDAAQQSVFLPVAD
jgi:hypothetical protein